MERASLEDQPCSNPSAVDAFAKKVLSYSSVRGNAIKAHSYHTEHWGWRMCLLEKLHMTITL